MDTVVTSSAPSRRRFLTGAAVGVAVLGAGGGAGAWWLNRGEEKSPTADVPPAVATPEAAFVSAIDMKPGEAPKALWGPLDVMAADGELPLPVRDVVIVQAKTGGLLALSVTNGKERWRAKDIDADAGFVSVADRLVVGVDKNGVLNAFVASTGAPVWQTQSDVDDVLAADDTHVYLVTKDNELRAVDAWTLATTWTRPMTSPRSQNGPAKAVVGRKRLVIHGRDGLCAALYTATGETDWELKGQGTDGQAPALGDNNAAYFGGRKLTARRLDRGDSLWEEEAKSSAGVWGTPTATGGLVFAMNSYNAYRYSTMRDVSFPVSDWYEVMDGTGPGTVNPCGRRGRDGLAPLPGHQPRTGRPQGHPRAPLRHRDAAPGHLPAGERRQPRLHRPGRPDRGVPGARGVGRLTTAPSAGTPLTSPVPAHPSSAATYWAAALARVICWSLIPGWSASFSSARSSSAARRMS